jgi:hypothetical protein
VFFQYYVGEATPGDLGAIRLLICGIRFIWLEAANFRSILYRSALSPMHFDFDVSLALSSAPDTLIEVLALLELGGELLYG